MVRLVRFPAVLHLLILITMGSVALADANHQKALSARSLEFWSTGDLSNISAVFADDYQNHQAPDVEGGPKTIDLAEWSSVVSGFHASFPQTRVTIFLQTADQHYVTTRWGFEGVQSGEYLGLAPTGKTVSWTGIQIDRFEDGKIAETWVNWDMYSMFKQLGIIE